MDTATLVVMLSLAVLLPTNAVPCGPQRPDSTTASKLLGTWLYVAGAAQYPPHQVEQQLIDHAYLRVDSSAGQELLITHYVAVGDQCFTNNLTYFEVIVGNATLVKQVKTHQTEGMLMDVSSDDLLLVQYEMQKDKQTYLGQYFYARNRNISRAEQEEFEQNAECLGLRPDQVVYAPWRTDVCQAELEGGQSPHPAPTAAVTASPAPGGVGKCQPGASHRAQKRALPKSSAAAQQ